MLVIIYVYEIAFHGNNIINLLFGKSSISGMKGSVCVNSFCAMAATLMPSS